MPFFCQKCDTEVVWMKQLPTRDNPQPKSNPIEVQPHERGNLVIDRKRNLYRFATDEEKEYAAIYNKNLYISHFATCEHAKSFRKK